VSFFVHKDLRWLECADPSPLEAVERAFKRHVIGLALILSIVIAVYVANLAIGFRVSAAVNGTLDGLPVAGDVSIARDDRDVPHIRARNLHDLFFAQGFAQGSDRLFQMDLTRRYAYGRLAEVFGAKAVALDEYMRAVDIAGVARRQWSAADAPTKNALEAFTAGVNAAEQREPLPAEFRLLLYSPAPWTAQDSIAVSIVAALALSDSWNYVLARDQEWRRLGSRCFDYAFPLSDPRYDVRVDGSALDSIGNAHASSCPAIVGATPSRRMHIGSNAWAAGSSRSADGHALLANDPHVDVTIPGIWYLMELRAPGFHAAGATLPGLPGILLGHNERIAWGATNAEVATTVLYRSAPPPNARRFVEQLRVRFASTQWKTYYRSNTEFSVDDRDSEETFVRWPIYWQRRSSITTILSLDRADTISAAIKVLRAYRGAPENFVVADSAGKVAYHLAGLIPNDPAWGRYVHQSADLAKPLRLIPFDELPHQDASKSAIALTANNRMYGTHYRYRLSAAFEPPYRAYRIASMLRGRSTYDIAYFRAMQLDTYSPIDAEIVARTLRLDRSDAIYSTSRQSRKLLGRWNGRFDPDSRAASLAHDIREDLQGEEASLSLLLQRLRGSSSSNYDAAQIDWSLSAAPPLPPKWATAGAVDVQHPLSSTWYGMMRGRTLPGDGDEYTIRLQSPGFAQGFRAVWSVGDWDAGGISIPSGESGEPGSSHYDDQAPAWIAGVLEPLPFSREAVTRSTVATLALRN
jgi:penicillin G amidase